MPIKRYLSSIHSLVTGLLLAVMLAGSGGLVGCATVMSEGGGDRPLHISSTPEGARVFVKQGMREWQEQSQVTPTTIYLDPVDGGGDYQLRLELEGYEPLTGYIGSDLDPWVFGSVALIVLLVIPGLVATGVDFATGAWKKLDTDHLHFDFPQKE